VVLTFDLKLLFYLCVHAHTQHMHTRTHMHTHTHTTHTRTHLCAHTHTHTHTHTGTIQNHDREVKMCLIDSFKKTDTEFLQKASAVSPSWKDGTTAVCVLLLDETLYVANLGDSKVVLCRKEGGKLSHLRLSKDHSPTQVSYPESVC